MPHQGGGIHSAELILCHTEGHNGRILGSQPLVGELLVERHVAVAIDGTDDGGVAASGELFNLANDGLVVLMVEGGVLLHNVFRRHTLGQEHSPEDLVGCPGIDVICTEEVEFLVFTPLFAHQVFNSRDSLLVGGSPGVEDISRTFFTLILHRVEEQPVVPLKDGQHRLAAYRSPAAENHRYLLLEQEVLRLLGEEVPVGGRIDDNGLDGPAQHPSLGVDLFDGHKDHIFDGDLADSHGPAEGVKDPYFDGVLGRVRVLRKGKPSQKRSGCGPHPDRGGLG